MNDNIETLTNDRIEQILTGAESPDEKTRAHRQGTIIQSISELWNEKGNRLPKLNKNYHRGPKLSEDELQKTSRKIFSMARNYFDQPAQPASVEFSNKAEDAMHKVTRSPWLRYAIGAIAAAYGLNQLENVVSFSSNNSESPLIYGPLTAAGLLLMGLTAKNHGAIKEGPYIKPKRKIKVPNKRQEITIPKLAYNAAQLLNEKWCQPGPEYSALRHGLAKSFERYVANEFSTKEDNHIFHRNATIADRKELINCYHHLQHGKRVNQTTSGSVLFQLCERFGNGIHQDIFRQDIDIFDHIKTPGKTKKLRGQEYLDSIE